MVSWFSSGTNGPAFLTVYESGFGTNATLPSPAPRVGYNCLGIVGPTCGDDDGTGPDVPQTEIWGATASYFGSYDDKGTATASDDTGTISWTGTSGTAVLAGFELFATSVASGTYDVATGILTTSAVDVTSGGLGGGMNCWNNPTASATYYGANFCTNGTGISTMTTAPPQNIASKFLPLGSINFVRDGGPGGANTIRVVMGDDAFSACSADPNCTPSSATSDQAVAFSLTVSNVPVPAAVWLFGSALGLLGWLRRKTS